MGTLSGLCNQQTLYRTTHYSNIYRASFILGTEQGTWDIEKIHIPLEEDKEAAFREYYKSISDTVLTKEEITAAVTNHVLCLDQLRGLKQLEKSVLQPRYIDIDQEEDGNGRIVYIATKPSEPILGRQGVWERKIRIRSLLAIGNRLFRAYELLSERGIFLGDPDINSIVLSGEGSGRLILIKSFLNVSGKPFAKVKPLTRLYEDKEVLAGEKERTRDSDYHAVARFIWNIASGDGYRSVPDMKHKPAKAPDQLIEILNMMLEEKVQTKEVKTAFMKTSKEIGETESDNYYISFRNRLVENEREKDLSMPSLLYDESDEDEFDLFIDDGETDFDPGDEFVWDDDEETEKTEDFSEYFDFDE